MDEEQYLKNLFNTDIDRFWKYVVLLKKYYDRQRTIETISEIGDIKFMNDMLKY